MANKKISDLTALGTTPDVADIIPITDVSGTPTTKSVTVANLMAAAPVQTSDLANYSPAFFTIVSETTTARTLSDSDNGKVIVCSNSAATTVTIPSGLTSGFGCTIVQNGTGVVSIEGSGASVYGFDSKTATAGQYGSINVYNTGTNTYVLEGDTQSPPFVNTYSLSLDGTNDFVQTDYVPSAGSTFSGSVWIKTSDTSNSMAFFSMEDGNGTYGITLKTPGSNKNWWVVGPTFTTNGQIGGTGGAASIRDGNWHHIALTVNSQTIKIYTDGSLVGTTTLSASAAYVGPNPPASGNLTNYRYLIGRGYAVGQYQFNGLMDEVALFETELTASQVTDIYNSGVPTHISSLSPAGYWRMGDNDSGTGTTVTDQGIGGNDGSLINGPTFSTTVPS